MGRISFAVRDDHALWNGRTLSEWVPEIVDAVVREFSPERVVLFGSVADGTDGPDSDVDLLVVLAVAEPVDRRRLMTEMRRATRHVAAPHDLVVTDVRTYERDRRRPGTVEYEAATTGSVLYERPAA
ncbi:MAG: nucleotidyltransferase domain-containing protein [Actinomycetota bacterium]|nr:nucleotidyltransferase domain-containing protein [Actinomycetota bacterium]